MYHSDSSYEKAEVNTLISEKSNLTAKRFIRCNKEDYVIMKGVILQEDVTTLDVYPSNNRSSKFKNLQRRRRNPLLVEDPTPLRHSWMDQKGHGWTERSQESVPFSLPGS